MAQDPYRYFRPEACDLVDRCIKAVLELDGTPDKARLIAELLRLAHTLKGAARVVEQSEIAEAAHAIEETLAPLKNQSEQVTRAQTGELLGHLDAIAQRIAMLTPEALPEKPKARAKQATPRIARADMGEADVVLDGVAHAHALVNRLRRVTEVVAPLLRAAELDTSRNDLARDVQRRLSNIDRRLVTGIERVNRELVQVGLAAQRLRLAPVESLFASLARTAHDVARDQAKLVQFESSGGELRIDLHVLEAIQTALIQLVRNAVAHGVESPAERIANGKAATGRISVHVEMRAGLIEVACRDDGAGVDYEAVRRAAREAGTVMDSDSAPIADMARLLLHGGLSTAQKVTQASGRGVGLDLARESLERLGGEIFLETKRGEGTTFRLRAPASLSSMEALGVVVGDSPMSMPLAAVRAAVRLAPEDIRIEANRATIRHEDVAVPFVALAAILFETPWQADRAWTAVIAQTPEGLIALGVDRLIGLKSIVIRPIPAHAAASPAIGGASLDLDGNPELVLDMAGVAAILRTGDLAALSEPQRPRRPVLVIDDSMTTRMLEKSILEAAGYEVDLAQSAEEGLDRLLDKRFGVILVDVEMPGMDGFDFIGRLRNGSVQPDVPAVLLTSRTSPEDFQRGRDVGANAHLSKGAFDQAGLLTTVAQLMV
jgi:two-component system chemotaxis sensor kinase CheA